MICLFVFAIIRELICWYFKINKRVELQEKILVELVKFNKTSNLIVGHGGITGPATTSNKPVFNDYNKKYKSTIYI